MRELRIAGAERNHQHWQVNSTTPSVPGTPTAVLGRPLTAANALDVWNQRRPNRTSDAVRGQLLDSTQLQIAHQTLKDFTLKFDGSLFELPGGPLRAAVGAEYIEYTMRSELRVSAARGLPAATRSRPSSPRSRRDVRIRRVPRTPVRGGKRLSGDARLRPQSLRPLRRVQ